MTMAIPRHPEEPEEAGAGDGDLGEGARGAGGGVGGVGGVEGLVRGCLIELLCDCDNFQLFAQFGRKAPCNAI